MTTSCPKTRALTAHQAGLLSPSADERVLKHLRVCSICRNSLAAMQLFEQSAEFIRSEPQPELAWERMDRKLAEVVREESRRRRVRSLALPAAVVFAAAAVALLWINAESSAPLAPVARTQAAPALPIVELPPPAAHSATLTAIAGCISSSQHEGACLELGATVEQGDDLSSELATGAHLRLRDGTGVVLASSTRLQWNSLNERVIRIGLQEGSLSSDVAPLREGQVYEVQAGPWTVSVRGTRFTVVWRDSRLEVAVDEGAVDVSRAGSRAARVEAPMRWASAGTTSPELVSAQPRPVGLSAQSDAWPILGLPAEATLKSWRVGDGVFATEFPLRMRVPAGELTVFGTRQDGTLLSAIIEMSEGETLFETSRLSPEGESPTRAMRGTLPAEAVRSVVRQGLPGLRRCYETALRRYPQQGGRFLVRLQVGRDGSVRSSQVRGDDGPAPSSLQSCLTTRVSQWRFPAPRGGTVAVDVPLRFAPRTR